jgi:hypothetical protein
MFDGQRGSASPSQRRITALAGAPCGDRSATRYPACQANGVIAAGLGYLSVGLLFIAAWVWWLFKGRAIMVTWVDSAVARYAHYRGFKRFFAGSFGSTALRESDRERARAAYRMWLAFVLVAPLFGALLVASAVAEFIW